MPKEKLKPQNPVLASIFVSKTEKKAVFAVNDLRYNHTSKFEVDLKGLKENEAIVLWRKGSEDCFFFFKRKGEFYLYEDSEKQERIGLYKSSQTKGIPFSVKSIDDTEVQVRQVFPTKTKKIELTIEEKESIDEQIESLPIPNDADIANKKLVSVFISINQQEKIANVNLYEAASIDDIKSDSKVINLKEMDEKESYILISKKGKKSQNELLIVSTRNGEFKILKGNKQKEFVYYETYEDANDIKIDDLLTITEKDLASLLQQETAAPSAPPKPKLEKYIDLTLDINQEEKKADLVFLSGDVKFKLNLSLADLDYKHMRLFVNKKLDIGFFFVFIEEKICFVHPEANSADLFTVNDRVKSYKIKVKNVNISREHFARFEVQDFDTPKSPPQDDVSSAQNIPPLDLTKELDDTPQPEAQITAETPKSPKLEAVSSIQNFTPISVTKQTEESKNIKTISPNNKEQQKADIQQRQELMKALAESAKKKAKEMGIATIIDSPVNKKRHVPKDLPVDLKENTPISSKTISDDKKISEEEQKLQNFVALLIGNKNEPKKNTFTERITAKKNEKIEEIREKFAKVLNESLSNLMNKKPDFAKFITEHEDKHDQFISSVIRDLSKENNIFNKHARFHYRGFKEDPIKSLVELIYGLFSRQVWNDWWAGRTQMEVTDPNGFAKDLEEHSDLFDKAFANIAEQIQNGGKTAI